MELKNLGQTTKRLLIGLPIVLGFGAVLVFSQQNERDPAEPKLDAGQVDRAEKVRAANEARLLSIPGVIAVGMGATETGDRPAIHVFVNLRLTGGKIPASIPKQIDNVPVRILATDEIKAR